MTRNEAIKFIIEHEGGYVNNPKDPGGETKYGIAKKFYPNEDIKNLTVDRAVEIYKKDYWDKCRCDEMPMAIALYVFDTAVNQGCGFAIKMLQTALGINADGIIGKQTLDKIKQVSLSKLIDDMSVIRVDRYKKTANFDTFGKGWLIREEKTRRKAKQIC